MSIKRFWHFRGFILGSVGRELKARYLNSILGPLWIFIPPLVLILIYTVVFSGLFKSKLSGSASTMSYGIYLCAGLLPFNFFSELILKLQAVFVTNGSLIKKNRFPNSSLVLIALLTSLVNFFVSYFVFICVALFYSDGLGLQIWQVLPLLVVQGGIALGLGVTLGVLNVFYRDVAHVTTIGLQLLFWATPIVYLPDHLPEWTKKIIALNPIAKITAAYQNIILGNQSLVWLDLLPSTLFAILMIIISILFYKKQIAYILDEV